MFFCLLCYLAKFVVNFAKLTVPLFAKLPLLPLLLLHFPIKHTLFYISNKVAKGLTLKMD